MESWVSKQGIYRHRLNCKIMVGMCVLTANQVFTGTDNASGEGDNDRLKQCELAQARPVRRILQAQAKWWGLQVV